MYQNFKGPKLALNKNRIQKLRTEIQKHYLDGFLIPRSDMHQNEYIEPCDARLEWMTGFTGSAGMCLITLESAFIFVDGRYTIQVKKEVDKDLYVIVQNSEISFTNWFKANCHGQTIGYDPWLHTVSGMVNLTNLKDNKIILKECVNLVDLIWNQKPKRIPQLITTHPRKFSGSNSIEKRDLISKAISRNGADAVILTKPESICWLLNIRGKDISHTPIVQSLAIFYKNAKIKLFLRETKLSSKILSFLGKDVKILSQLSFKKIISSLRHKNIQIDPSSCPTAILNSLKSKNKNIIQSADPCLHLKAIKNSTEIKGARQAHLIDAAALSNFLCWLETDGKTKQLDEIMIAKKLEEFRQKTNLLEELAFDTICGFGSNGAIVHYKVNEHTNRKIEDHNLLLIDSGGQYRMGTTDVTRTIIIGRPKQEMINVFTHVLKGMIAVSDLKWPQGLSGQHIDSLARSPLWSIGLDYDHGTGHGIGSYLSVHEGPQGLSRKNSTKLEAGMIISNEPGYYKTGKFGIRIENALLVKKLPKKMTPKDKMLYFETLTLVPIDKRLINVAILTEKEKDWLNNYHNQVYKKISPLVTTKTKNWLKENCTAL